ncbi:MAG: FHA domain-containing protein [bacterium]
MLIKLEQNGVSLFEADTGALDKDIEVGRSSQCAWRVPADEKDVSSRHVRISRKGGAVWIEDLDSSNGTYYHGKTIKKLKLKPGMRIGVGTCIIAVEAGGATGPVESIPEIVMLSGRSRGQRKDIRPGTFTIGSDPGSSMNLLDMLISRHHAEIVMKEDKSCWMKDLGSKNGTSVNDTPLRSGQERLLKDGDKISFAHFEARFYDGTSKRSNKMVWIRLGVVAATILVVLGLYASWQRLKPSATAYIERARDAAAEEDLGAARQMLDKAAQARGAATRELEISDLSRLVSLWDSTLSTWRSARDNLHAGEWVRASRDLGSLYALKPDAWTWSPDATDEKNATLRAKTMLDTLLRAQGALRGDEVAGLSLEGELDSVQKVLSDNAGDIPEYLGKARTELIDIQAKLELFLSESHDLESALDSLGTWPPPYGNVIQVLDDTYRNSRGLLKRRSELMLDPVKALSRSYDQLMKALDLAHDMKFDDALKVALTLPSTSACALDSRVSAARAAIEATHQKLEIQINQLTYLFREVNKLVPEDTAEMPSQITAWKNRDALARMLGCDSLSQPMPRRSRKEPSGDYDRYLGIEEFYEYMVAVSLRQPWKEKADAPFPTILFQTESIINAVEALQAFFAKSDWAVQLTPVNTTYGVTRLDSGPDTATPTNAAAAAIAATPNKETAWLFEGKLAERVQMLREILVARDDLVQRVMRIATEMEDRPALMAAGIAYRLAANTADLKIKDESLSAYLIRSMQDNRNRLRELGQEYDLAAPSRQIAVRDDILKLGLPGDPIVKRMWSSFTASQQPSH